MEWLDLALWALGIFAAVVGLVYLFQRWERVGAATCGQCGAAMPDEEGPCNVCSAPYEAPSGTPHGRTGEPDPQPERAPRKVPQPTMDPDVGALNPGVRPWMIKGAVALMLIGLSVRGLGMLEPAGLDLGIPMGLMTVLTVLGGIGAFLGFIVLDVA